MVNRPALKDLVAISAIFLWSIAGYGSHAVAQDISDTFVKTTEADVKTATLSSFPAKISTQCRDGKALIFDECADQQEIYRAASLKAEQENKTLLVIYGAEWCIWTHVFDRYLKGDYGAFTHTYSNYEDEERWTETMYERGGRNSRIEAQNLARFVSDNFVIAFIENNYSDGGQNVLEQSGADVFWQYSTPFVYSVDASGKVAQVFDNKGVETRRDTDDWFRGYNRTLLTEQLLKLKVAARSGDEVAVTPIP